MVGEIDVTSVCRYLEVFTILEDKITNVFLLHSAKHMFICLSVIFMGKPQEFCNEKFKVDRTSFKYEVRVNSR